MSEAIAPAPPQQAAEVTNVHQLLEKFGELREQAVLRSEQAASDLAAVRAFAVASDDDKVLAAGVISEFKTKLAEVEELRRSVTDPLNHLVKWVNDWFRPAKEARTEGERLLKQKLAAYVTARAEENRRLLAEAARAETAAQAQAAVAEMGSPALPRGTTLRQVWKFEVTDPAAVPHELCSPDRDKIARRGGQMVEGAPPAIPGVRWFQESIVSSRRA